MSEIAARINQRRRQLLVHSFLYYRMNMGVISDYQYDEFARELIELQAGWPDVAAQCIYAEAFEGFEMGDSFALPFGEPAVQEWTMRFLRAKDAIGK